MPGYLLAMMNLLQILCFGYLKKIGSLRIWIKQRKTEHISVNNDSKTKKHLAQLFL
jgi:hypothetical protein